MGLSPCLVAGACVEEVLPPDAKAATASDTGHRASTCAASLSTTLPEAAACMQDSNPKSAMACRRHQPLRKFDLSACEYVIITGHQETERPGL